MRRANPVDNPVLCFASRRHQSTSNLCRARSALFRRYFGLRMLTQRRVFSSGGCRGTHADCFPGNRTAAVDLHSFESARFVFWAQFTLTCEVVNRWMDGCMHAIFIHDVQSVRLVGSWPVSLVMIVGYISVPSSCAIFSADVSSLWSAYVRAHKLSEVSCWKLTSKRADRRVPSNGSFMVDFSPVGW